MSVLQTSALSAHAAPLFPFLNGASKLGLRRQAAQSATSTTDCSYHLPAESV